MAAPTAWVGKRRVMFMVALDGLVPKTNGWLARLQDGTTMDEGYGQVYR